MAAGFTIWFPNYKTGVDKTIAFGGE